MALVGEAELLVTLNSMGAEAKLATLGDEAGAGLASKADKVGQDAGAALSGGLATGTKDIGKETETALEKSTGRMTGIVGDAKGKMSGLLSGLGVPESLVTGWGGVALGVGAVAGAAIDLENKMQTADVSIATSAGISVKAATDIGNAFLGTAGKSEFSGIQQAKAFASVAGQLKATEGQALTTAQSLTFMNGVTDLATAKGIDLGTATSTVAGIMQAFQLPVSQVTTVTNTLFNASNATGQAVDSLGTSFEKIRSKLGAMAPPLTDLATLMLDMTKNGVTGRAALTGLNTAMTALQGAATGTTKTNLTAKATLAEYGIAAVQANGQLTPMSEIIDKLAPKFRTMTQAQQLQTAGLIFGASAAKQMTAVIDGGTKSYQASADAITRHNAVQDAAALKGQTLAGTFDKIKATVVDFGTQLGQMLMPVMNQLLQIIQILIPIIEDALRGAFAILAPVIQTVVGVLKTVVDALKSLIDFVKNVFTGNWSAAWNDVKNIFMDFVSWLETPIKLVENLFTSLPSGIKTALADVVNAIYAPFRDAFNAVITAYNDTIGRLHFSLFGMHFGAPTISELPNSLISTGSGAAAGPKINPKTGLPVGELGPPAPGTAAFRAQEDAARKKTEDATTHLPDAFVAPITAASTSAASKAASAATKAANTLTSEVIKAISLPANQAAEQLRLLGVPAKKATDVLHDAVLPFNEAVKALEKAGFDAADAVKIADAGQKANAAAAKAAIKAAGHKPTSAGTTATAASTTLTGISVNGIPVAGISGSFAGGAAGVGAAGSTPGATTGTGSTTSPTGAPCITITIAPGAIVINPAPGNDAASLLVTQNMVNNGLMELLREIEAGVLSTGPVHR